MERVDQVGGQLAVGLDARRRGGDDRRQRPRIGNAVDFCPVIHVRFPNILRFAAGRWLYLTCRNAAVHRRSRRRNRAVLQAKRPVAAMNVRHCSGD